MADLHGRVVAFLEGRRASEMADLITRHNGIPMAAPCLREVHSPDSEALQSSIAAVLDTPLDVAIFLTGVGTSTVFESAALMGRTHELRDRLADSTVVVRGPKPAAVLRKLGVRIDLAAPAPNTTTEVLNVLDDLDLQEKTVVVQLYGEPNPALSQRLGERGARVLELAPYVWDRPVDPAPILDLLGALDRNEVDALLITSQAQVDNLFAVAAEHQRRVSLTGVALAAQGPVAELALERHGLHADIRPAHGHMGALVLATAEYLSNVSVEGALT